VAPKFVGSAPLADIAASAPVLPEAPVVEDVAPVIRRDEVAPAPVVSKQAASFAPQPPSLPVAEDPPMPMAPYIPPQAERPIRPTRMPRVEDLPVPAQNQLRATRGEVDAAAGHDKRMTLLQRLATVGFGRKDEPAGHPAMPAEKSPAMPTRPIPDGAHRPAVSPVHAEYAKRPMPQGHQRPAQGTLDPHGRPVAQQRSLEDEHLEIPAFLRRQTN
jgi:cell division protein FtsZ